MREKACEKLERGRYANPIMGGSPEGAMYGAFVIWVKRAKLNVIAYDGKHAKDPWEHVSVSLLNSPGRCPTWEEMCAIKDLFWGEDECVVQFHPPKAQYVNNHSYCLHLWKPKEKIPLPDMLAVGIPGFELKGE